MAAKKSTKSADSKLRLKLTAEQEAQISTTMGKEFLAKIKDIEITKIAGFLKSEVRMN
jgi:hypothetical protein